MTTQAGTEPVVEPTPAAPARLGPGRKTTLVVAPVVLSALAWGGRAIGGRAGSQSNRRSAKSAPSTTMTPSHPVPGSSSRSVQRSTCEGSPRLARRRAGSPGRSVPSKASRGRALLACPELCRGVSAKDAENYLKKRASQTLFAWTTSERRDL
jgi:hypothetical protein